MGNDNNHLPNGTIVWKHGIFWGFLMPDGNGGYLSENIQYSTTKPMGASNVLSGKGSFKNSFHIIGTPPSKADFIISNGWTKTNVSINEGIIKIKTNSGSEGVNKRWSKKKHYKERKHKVKLPLEVKIRNALMAKHNYQSHNIASQWDWLRSIIYLRDNGVCWVCNKFVLLRDYDLGHLIDRCNGGSDTIDNCVVMHKRCNGGKPTHTTLEDATTWKLTHQISYQKHH